MHPDIVRVVLTKEEIDRRIAALGAQITADYQGKDLLVVGVLNGAVFVTADLVRAIDLPCLLDFVGVSSYGDSTQSSGTITMTKEPSISPNGKDVLLVEDVLDTGRSLQRLKAFYEKLGAKSVKICTMLDKPEAHLVPITADYAGGTVGNEFIVGYGLDYAQRYRNLPYIGILDPSVYA